GFTGVTVGAGNGADVLDFSATTLVGIAAIDGSVGNDTITGSAGADSVLGGGGRDSLVGGLGADTLGGGAALATTDGGDGGGADHGGEPSRVGGTGDGFDRYLDRGASGVDRILATANGTLIGLTFSFGAGSGIEQISANSFSGVSISGGTNGDTLDFSSTTL